MKKIIKVILITVFLISQQDLFAQPKTVEEIKTYICQYKWFLRRYEWDDKFFTVPKEHQGSFMVFSSNGKVFYHKRGESEINRTQYDWKLSGSKMTLTIHDGTRGTFKFKLEQFVGYKIYLSVEGGEDDGLTYVWEQSDKIIAGTVAAPVNAETVNKSNATQAATSFSSKSPHWYMLYTKGITMGRQAWIKRPTFPAETIKSNWSEKLYMTDISYGGDDRKWAITFATTGYSNQAYELRDTREEMEKAIVEICKKNPKYNVTQIAFIDNRWIVVVSEGSEISAQSILRGKEFPEDQIKEHWKKGYDITSMAYGKGGWLVVVSQGFGYKDQGIRKYDNWEHEKILAEIKQGFVMTSVAKMDNKWYVIVSKVEKITSADHKRVQVLSGPEVKTFLDAGYSLYKTMFIPGTDN